MSTQAAQSDKFIRMTSAPVRGLICRLAAPSIVIMLITTLYNMTDTFFVGQLGTSATAGVGVAFSLMLFIQSMGFFFGQGSGNYISRQLGAQNMQAVARMAATGFVSAFLFGVVIMVAGLVALDPLALMLGSTQTILPYARDYLRFILVATPWMAGSLVLNNILRFQGNPAYGMVGMVAGAVVGIGLTPLFIFVFGMGIAGAGLSTAIGQILSCVVLFIGCRRGDNIAINLREFSPSIYLYKEILRGGAPSLCRQGLASVSIVLFNHTAAYYGDAAIAAMTVVQRVIMFPTNALVGFGQGLQPVVGFNYGAERYDRVIKALWFCVKTSAVFLVAASLVNIAFAPQIVAFFQNDPLVVEIGAPALRFLSITFPLLSFFTLANMMLQTIGKAVRASALAASRQGFLFVFFLLILPRLFGLLGLQLSQPAADLGSFLLAIPLTWGVLRQMKRDWEERLTMDS